MKKLSRITRYCFYTLAGLLALYCAINGVLEIYPNFHTVIPGQIYRSAELSGDQYSDYIKKYQIKTVLNLEGASPNQHWYQDEIKATQQAGAQHIDYGMNAQGLASVEQLRQLTHIIATAPKPLLIHCWRGADRTGLGTVVSLLLFSDQPLDQIKQQLSVKYGVLSSQSVGVLEIQNYQTWLQENNLTSSRQNYLRWLAELQPGSNYQVTTS